MVPAIQDQVFPWLTSTLILSQASLVSTFIEVFSPRPDHTFQEIMAWSPSGFPSGPLPVAVLFSTKETAKTASIMASSAIIQNMPSPTDLTSVSSKIQEPMAPGSWIQDSTAQQLLAITPNILARVVVAPF